MILGAQRRSCRALGRVDRADLIAVAVLVLVPVVLVLPFTLVGHPLIPGDDLTQNYPLRVYAGDLLRSGHLPAWDPLIWSGTSLLAGWNAGALFPGTWLFAILPGVAAWTLNVIAVGVVCGIGTYLFLRRHHCRALAATLGALCFSDTGFMSGQLSHIGLVQGTALLPWSLLALDALASSRTTRVRARASLALALVVALCILAGEPRAISSEVVIAAVYLLALLCRAGVQRLKFLSATLFGCALGSAISAIQWLPGLSFIAASQRGIGAYTAFGAGSLDARTVLRSMLVPFFLGGSGNLGLAGYSGGYNLPEVTIGVGLLPLVAALAYLPELSDRVRSRLVLNPVPARPLPIELREGPESGTPPDDEPKRRSLGVWYVLGVVGLILTMGVNTPFGHLLVKIPLFGGQRLQNRNAVIFDFALSVLLAFFVDDLGRRSLGLRVFRESALLARRALCWLFVSLPFLVAIALIVVAYADPLGVARHFGVVNPNGDFFLARSPYLATAGVLAAGGALFVWLANHMQRRTRATIATVLVVVDILVYLVSAVYGTAPSDVLAGTTALSQNLQSLTGHNGRFAIYDPLQIGTLSTPNVAAGMGENDLNLLRGIGSVQGYSSIVAGAYQDATNTHAYETLAPKALASGLFDTLDLQTVLTLPPYLVQPIAPHAAVPLAGVPTSTKVANAAAPAPLASGPWQIPAGKSQQWVLPSTSTIARAAVYLESGSGQPESTSVAVGVANLGALAQLSNVPLVAAISQFQPPSPEHGDAIVVRNTSAFPITVGAVVAVTENPSARLLLDGALQGALPYGHFQPHGTLGPFSVFQNLDNVGPAWLQGLGTTAPSGPFARLGSVLTPDATSSGEPMIVHASAAVLLVRSDTYQAGWSAELSPLSGGPSHTAAVRRFGLIQAVEVPAGSYRVTWHYAPRSLTAGVVVSGVGTAAFLALFALFALGRRRRGLTGASRSEVDLVAEEARGRA